MHDKPRRSPARPSSPASGMQIARQAMQQLNRLHWDAQFGFTAYGVDATVRGSGPGLTDRIVSILPPGRKSATPRQGSPVFSLVAADSIAPNVPNVSVVYRNAQSVARLSNLSDALIFLENSIDLELAVYSPDLLFVHAGVVSLGGCTIVMPGRSMSGKSTLVNALVRHGASYLSDEFAVFNDEGRVLPYLRPIALRSRGEQKRHVLPVRTAGCDHLTVSLIVDTWFEPGATWKPKAISRARGMQILVDHSAAARRRPTFVFERVHRVITQPCVLSGVRGEADETAQAIIDYISSESI